MTYKEKSAIIRYIGGGSYAFNERIRQNLITEDDKKEIALLDSALEKLPSYKGRVYRTLHIPNRENLKDFLSEHNKGETVTYPSYTSSSTETGYSDNTNIHITINSKNGKDIRKLNQDESEVLFKRNSSFRILEFYKNNKVYYFLAEEIVNEEKF